MANRDERLRLVRSTIRAPANGRGQMRALPFCDHASGGGALDAIRLAASEDYGALR
jgi:hypothetical protein